MGNGPNTESVCMVGQACGMLLAEPNLESDVPHLKPLGDILVESPKGDGSGDFRRAFQ